MSKVIIDSFFQEKGLVFQQLGFGAHAEEIQANSIFGPHNPHNRFANN